MHAEKVSISLPESLVRFVEHYRVAHHCKTRSQVFEEALELLRARELEEAYREADREADTAAWDAVTADGLADETW
jgi:antitoxin MazE9